MIIEKLSDNKKLIDAVNKIHSEPWPVFLSEDSSVLNGRYEGNNFIVKSSTKIDNIKFRDRIIAKLESLLDIMKDKKIIKKILEVQK